MNLHTEQLKGKVHTSLYASLLPDIKLGTALQLIN